MKKKSKAYTWLIAILVILPISFSILKTSALELFAKKMNVQILYPYLVKNVECDSNHCIKTYQFDPGGNSFENPTIGYYGAHLDSRIVIQTEAKAIPPTLRYSWHSFIKKPLTKTEKFDLITVSGIGSKRLGLESGYVFFGGNREIEKLSFIYDLFSVHIYSILASALFILLLFVLTSPAIKSKIDRKNLLFSGLVLLSALILFSKIPNEFFRLLGATDNQIYSLPKFAWAPAILILIYKRHKKIYTISVIAWTILISISFTDTSLGHFLSYNLYRWQVLSILLLTTSLMLKYTSAFLNVILLSPIVLDVLVLFGIIPQFGSIFLSPLTFPAFFIATSLPEIKKILAFQKYWMAYGEISSIFEELKTFASKDSSRIEEIARLILPKLSETSRAERVSICIMKKEQPIILSYSKGKVSKISDGQIPPFFSRVFQTGEPILWGKENDVKAVLSGRGITARQGFSGDLFTILPIRSTHATYGCISLTNFEDDYLIESDSDFREMVLKLTQNTTDFISNLFIAEEKDSSEEIRITTQLVTRAVNQKISTETDPNKLKAHYLNSLREHIPSRFMYFEVNSDGIFTLASCSGVSDEIREFWSNIPFRARTENKLSPFAISVNEKKSIYLPNIRNFYELLQGVSREALTLTGTRSFISVPIIEADYVIGLVVAFDDAVQDTNSRGLRDLIEETSKVLVLGFAQIDQRLNLQKKDQLLSRIIDPELLEASAKLIENNVAVVGEVIECFLLVIDIRGSTAASKNYDPEDLAIRTSNVYNVIGAIGREYGAVFEKGNGDGVLLTIKISDRPKCEILNLCHRLLNDLPKCSQENFGVSSLILSVHIGSAFRGVFGSSARLSWDTSGLVVNEVYSIEKDAKSFENVVLAISENALIHIRNGGFRTFELPHSSPVILKKSGITYYQFSRSDLNSIFEDGEERKVA